MTVMWGLESPVITNSSLFAQARASYVEWFGEKTVQSSPGRGPQAVSPALASRKIADDGFNAAS